MLKRVVLLPLLLAALFAPVLAIAGPAEAARNRTPGCITKAEFRAVKKGTDLARARKIVGAPGRTTFSSDYSDGDAWRSIQFRQCGRTWNRSYVSMSFESTEREVWIDSCQYGYYDGCGYDGFYETRYSYPLVLESKSAFWA